MAELTIRPEEIRDALDNFVQNYEPETAVREEVGTVVTSGDGIAHVEGLPSAMANELLRFENGTMGIALNLEERQIGVVVLGDSDGIDEGSTVRGTGEVLSVPVGEGYLGRVVDAMGNPVDGLGEIKDVEGRRALEIQAAGVMDRQEVREPLQTGLKAIDSMIRLVVVSVSSSSVTARLVRPPLRSTPSSTRRATGNLAILRSRFAASTSPLDRRARLLRR